MALLDDPVQLSQTLYDLLSQEPIAPLLCYLRVSVKCLEKHDRNPLCPGNSCKDKPTIFFLFFSFFFG